VLSYASDCFEAVPTKTDTIRIIGTSRGGPKTPKSRPKRKITNSYVHRVFGETIFDSIPSARRGVVTVSTSRDWKRPENRVRFEHADNFRTFLELSKRINKLRIIFIVLVNYNEPRASSGIVRRFVHCFQSPKIQLKNVWTELVRTKARRRRYRSTACESFSRRQ